MFDVGFTELVLIAVLGLIVVGPERLPTAAKKAGAWIGRAKRTFNNIQLDIKRELDAEELRKSLMDDGKLGDDISEFGRALTDDILNNRPEKTPPADTQARENKSGAPATPGTKEQT